MLTPYTGPRSRLRFRTYDLEWFPKTLKLRCAGVFDGARYTCYDDMADFLDSELTAENRGIIWFAHAGGLADVQFVLTEIMRRRAQDVKVEAIFSGSSAIIVKVMRGRNSWTFCDSLWLLKSGLQTIAESLGQSKEDTWTCADYDASRTKGDRCQHEREKEKCVFYAPMGILRSYNEQDCRILYGAIDRFQEELLELGGALRLTVASCAMRLFRSRYLTRTINTDSIVNTEARDAYFSSRTEPFANECSDASMYDINSSFPFSMTDPNLPGSLIRSGRTIPKKGIYLADVDVLVPESYLPPLPYRAGGRVFFPWGRWRGWYCDTDLELLESVGGRILEVFRVREFEPMPDLTEYVHDLYAKRKASTDEFRRMLLKYLLNSCYGKFGESGVKERVVWNPASHECPHNGIHVNEHGVSECIRDIRPGLVAIADTVEVPHEHVPMAVKITALSRKQLYGWIDLAHRQLRKPVYYCDCDSVATKATLPVGRELGQLKLEKHIDSARFIAPKLYRVNDTIKAKGFPRLSLDDFAALDRGDAIEFRRMLRVRELFRKGLDTPQEIVTEKRLWENKTKRKHIGNDSRPWHLNELND